MRLLPRFLVDFSHLLKPYYCSCKPYALPALPLPFPPLVASDQNVSKWPVLFTYSCRASQRIISYARAEAVRCTFQHSMCWQGLAHSDLPYPTLLQVDKIGACLIGLDLVCKCTQPTVIDMSCRDFENDSGWMTGSPPNNGYLILVFSRTGSGDLSACLFEPFATPCMHRSLSRGPLDL